MVNSRWASEVLCTMMPACFKPFDIFISYAAEDRETVEELVRQLEARGLHVWYTGQELYPGADIHRLVQEGLDNSRYGLALISPHYNSYWTAGELFTLRNHKERLIPVLHHISLQEVILKMPGLAGIYALTTETGLGHAVHNITNRVHKRPWLCYKIADWLTWIGRHRKWLTWITLGILLLFLLLGAWYYTHEYPSDTDIQKAVDRRISLVQANAENTLQHNIIQLNGKQQSLTSINLAYDLFTRNAIHHRNKYDFFDGQNHISSVAGLKNAGILDNFGQPAPPFGMDNNRAYQFPPDSNSFTYAVLNTAPVTYQVRHVRKAMGGLVEVELRFTHFIRYAQVVTSFDKTTSTQHKMVSLLGFRPVETLIFQKKGEDWVLLHVK